MKKLVLLLVCFVTLAAQAQSGLNRRQFAKYWRVESEAPDYQVSFRGDTCEILSPKGLTLWRKEKMRQGMTVEYADEEFDITDNLVYVHYRQIPTHKPKLALWVLLISFVLLQMCWWGINYLPAAQGSSVHVYNS